MGPLVLIWNKPCFGVLNFKNGGQLGSRYVYIIIYIGSIPVTQDASGK